MATLIKIHPDGREEIKESGSRVQAIELNEDWTYKGVKDNKPVVGCSLLVGSVTARSYSNKDFWLTTKVTEIVEETKDYIIFTTGNSKYKLIK